MIEHMDPNSFTGKMIMMLENFVTSVALFWQRARNVTVSVKYFRPLCIL